MTFSSADISSKLKRVYGDVVQDLYGRHTMTYNQFLKTNRRPGGRPGGEGYYFSLRQSDLQAVGARGESQYLPEPLTADGVQGYIRPKLVYAVLRMSGLAIEVGKTNVESFVNTQADATMNAFKSLTHDLNRQCWGDGYGALATVSTAATTDTAATWTVTCSNDKGVRYLRKGMVVDFYTGGATLNTNAVALRISSINPNTQVVTMEAVATGAGGGYRAYHPIAAGRTGTNTDASTIAANSIIVRYGARVAAHTSSATSYEIMGMAGMFDDATLLGTFEGVTVSDGNDTEFRANVIGNSSVNRELSIDLMLSAMDMTAARSDATVDTIWMGLGQRRKYFGLLAPDVRYAPGEFLGGYERLRFSQNGQVQMIVDPMTPPNQMFFAPIDAIRKFELTPIGWGGFDPNKMHWRQDYDEATMFLRTYTNLGVENRPALTLLDDLVEPSSAPW